MDKLRYLRLLDAQRKRERRTDPAYRQRENDLRRQRLGQEPRKEPLDKSDPDYRVKKNAAATVARHKRFEDPEYRAKKVESKKLWRRAKMLADPEFRAKEKAYRAEWAAKNRAKLNEKARKRRAEKKV